MEALVDFFIFNQAQRLPVGGGERALRCGSRRQLLVHALAQHFLEDTVKCRHVALQVLLSDQYLVTFGDASGRSGHGAQDFGHALSDRRGGHLDLIHCRFESGLQSWFDGSHFGPGRTPGWRNETGRLRCGPASNLSMGPNARAIERASAPYFFSASRISRRRTTSSGVAAGGAGGVAVFRRLICLTIMKMMKASIRKFNATVMKLP